jgi:hypothetical protein
VIEGLGSLRKDSSGKINFIEAPEIIEIDNRDDVETEKVAVVLEKQEIPQVIEKKIQKIIEKKTPKKPKVKTSTLTKNKTKKAPIKVKSPRITKPLPKTLPPEVPLQAIEPVAVEPEEVIEATPVELQTAIETIAVEPETAIEASSVLAQEAVDAAVAELQDVIEPASREAQQTIKPVPPPASLPLQIDEPAGTDDRPSKISTNRILVWVLIILFINACILGWFVFRRKTHGTPAGKTVTTMISDTLYDQLADSVRAAALDSSIVYDEVPSEGGNLKENALAPGSRYYIVAGCFRDEVNADSLVSSLKLLGYKAEKFGKIGNLYSVCFASFDNKDIAVTELKKIREKVPSAWMTKF